MRLSLDLQQLDQVIAMCRRSWDFMQRIFLREIRSVQELIRSVKRCETLPVYYKEGGYYLWDMKNPIDAPFHIYEQEQMVCAG